MAIDVNLPGHFALERIMATAPSNNLWLPEFLTESIVPCRRNFFVTTSVQMPWDLTSK